MSLKVQQSRSRWRKRLFVFSVLALSVALLGVVTFSSHPPMPPAERQVRLWLAETGQITKTNRFDDFGTDTIPYLVAYLTNRSSRAERLRAIVAERSGPNLYWRMPSWLRHFLTPARSVEDRASAEVALTCMPHKSAVLAALVPLLQDPRDYVRGRVARILRSRTTREDTNWLPALLKSLSLETNAASQVELAWAIGRIDTNATAVLSLLRAKTNDPDRYVRTVAIRGLNEVAAGGGLPEQAGRNR